MCKKSAIYEQLICAIPFWSIVVQNFVQILCQIMRNICHVDSTQISVHSFACIDQFVNNIQFVTTWFAEMMNAGLGDLQLLEFASEWPGESRVTRPG